MIAINKAEKEAIRERFPKAHIVRTMRQKSKRHRYYCEESRYVMNYLEELRNSLRQNTTIGSDKYTTRKKTK